MARKVQRKVKQNLFWATIYTMLAIPIAAWALYPAFHILLRPECAALLMSASTVIVTVNALVLNRWTYAYPAPARPMTLPASPGQD